MDDMAESDPREQEAAKHDINYIGMDGNIACLGKPLFSLLLEDNLCKYFVSHVLSERCRIGNGYDGHHQALRWRSGQFPRCGRKRPREAGLQRI